MKGPSPLSVLTHIACSHDTDSDACALSVTVCILLHQYVCVAPPATPGGCGGPAYQRGTFMKIYGIPSQDLFLASDSCVEGKIFKRK